MADRVFKVSNARIIDPSQSIDAAGDLSIVDGRFGGKEIVETAHLQSIDATGLIACPGLIDLHVHLREPGGEHKETIATGGQAAVAGGFTTVCCMPNTRPPLDSVEMVRWVVDRAAETSPCRVKVVAAVTVGRAGSKVTDFDGLLKAGAVAFSDDGDGIEDAEVMRRALERAKEVGAVITAHCQFNDLVAGGVVNSGEIAERLGLPGWDVRGEDAMIERDIALCEKVGARYHVAHISTAAGMEMVRCAKAKGLPVTAEACPHHLLLCDEDVIGPDGNADPNFKMNPPLRKRSDVAACIEGVRDGTIDCVVTDHAPHTAEEKARGFLEAPFGIVGLETALGCAARALFEDGRFGWPELIDRMSTRPARLFGLEGGSLAEGSVADFVLIDPEVEWTVDASRFESKSSNSPYVGWKLKGKPVATIVGGRFVYVDKQLASKSLVEGVAGLV